MSLFVTIYLDLRLPLFSAHSSFSWIYAHSDFLCSLKHVSWRTGIYAFFLDIYVYFPGKYGSKIHEVQKCQKWCNCAHVEKNRSKSRNLSNDHLCVFVRGYRYRCEKGERLLLTSHNVFLVDLNLNYSLFVLTVFWLNRCDFVLLCMCVCLCVCVLCVFLICRIANKILNILKLCLANTYVMFVCTTFYNCQPIITTKKNRSANKIDMRSFNVYIYILYRIYSIYMFPC